MQNTELLRLSTSILRIAPSPIHSSPAGSGATLLLDRAPISANNVVVDHHGPHQVHIPTALTTFIAVIGLIENGWIPPALDPIHLSERPEDLDQELAIRAVQAFNQGAEVYEHFIDMVCRSNLLQLLLLEEFMRACSSFELRDSDHATRVSQLVSTEEVGLIDNRPVLLMEIASSVIPVRTDDSFLWNRAVQKIARTKYTSSELEQGVITIARTGLADINEAMLSSTKRKKRAQSTIIVIGMYSEEREGSPIINSEMDKAWKKFARLCTDLVTTDSKFRMLVIHPRSRNYFLRIDLDKELRRKRPEEINEVVNQFFASIRLALSSQVLKPGEKLGPDAQQLSGVLLPA